MGKYVNYERVCSYCGTTFTAHDKRKIYCTKKCKDIALRIKKGITCNPNPDPFQKICIVCGRPFNSFRETAVTCSHECAQKYRNRRRNGNKSNKTWDEWLKELELQKKQNKEQKELQKARKQVINVLSARINKMHPRVCKECGKVFYSQYPTQLYCGKQCSVKRHRPGHDKRIPKSQIVDTDITLRRLYKRDNGTCYICGCRCDFNDWRKSKSGNKYPGDMYPTKDHVIPVAMGGKESWENVRLACWKCNLEKSDSVIGIAEMPSKIARRVRYIPNKKRTAQYSLDGNLIRIWDSTADIRRELGLNDTHIQTVCRKDKSNTGNAYGYHWEYVDEMSKVKFELNLPGLNALMKSGGMQSQLQAAGQAVANAADGNYGVRVHEASFVAIANVYPADKETAKKNAKENSLLKGLGAAGLPMSK